MCWCTGTNQSPISVAACATSAATQLVPASTRTAGGGSMNEYAQPEAVADASFPSSSSSCCSRASGSGRPRSLSHDISSCCRCRSRSLGQSMEEEGERGAVESLQANAAELKVEGV